MQRTLRGFRRTLFQRSFLGLFCLFVLHGCTPTATLPNETGARSTPIAVLEKLDNWTVTGKVALRSTEASQSASMTWQQQAKNTELQLQGPLGIGNIRVRSDGDWLEVFRAGQHSVVDVSNPEAIIANTGWDLPLQSLPYWLRGIPAPTQQISSQRSSPDSGQLKHLTQSGWAVDYTAYGEFEGYWLPTKLTVSKDDTKATVILRRWEIEEQ